MSQDGFSGPDLAGVVADANAVGLAYVVIGGFSVIANGYVRATNDSALLVPDGTDSDAAILRFLDRAEATRLRDGKRLTADDVAGAEHLRVITRHGIVDVMRGGLAPLDYDTVAARAMELTIGGRRREWPASTASSASSDWPDVPGIATTSKSSRPSTASFPSSRSPGSTAEALGALGRLAQSRATATTESTVGRSSGAWRSIAS